ncbi:MAG: isoleucine--tRNA ligase, partial [Candidatus Babeliales bacterium]
NLYTDAFTHNKGKQKFIVHDGPPYANGHIHLGHAYNKILKDIICKARRMAGYHVPFTPGWDCHGLPIEINVTKESPNLPPMALKKECRAYAQRWIDTQKQEFKTLGVLADWANPYLTMDNTYEANILRAFADFVSEGYIDKKNKTVPWCFSCQTVLATAEIEYKERKDPSLYVLFAVHNPDLLIPKHLPHKKTYVAIWTTTPWTLPLNRAVIVKQGGEYVMVEHNDTYIILGATRAAQVCETAGIPYNQVGVITADQLLSTTAMHPFVSEMQVPFIASPHVSLEDGTALVHCAPGCGPEDYELGVQNGLEIFSPISADGKYTYGIIPESLEGMSVTEAHGWVITQLMNSGALLHKESIKHAYPHCWRCRNGLIFRATRQWFLNLAHNNLREKALQAIETIEFAPKRSIGFLRATIAGRLEWCISRQRVWGVPIPALLCTRCAHATITPALVRTVADRVESRGVEYWDEVPVAELTQHMSCTSCGNTEFTKEHDILDVWFDSGVSHYAVLYKNKELGFPADVYLEGVDQHRGWFQSSLLTSMALEKEAAMKTIVTHGFTVDDKGHKMSKSLGNVVTPAEIIKRLGTDGLRLWASSITHGGDAVVSESLMTNVAEVYRKIRNTLRFLLSNLYDYKHETDALAIAQLQVIDQYALEKLFSVHLRIQEAYERYDFTAVFHELADYCSHELSALYLDIIKDRLYVEAPTSMQRRSAQTVLWYILDTLTRDMAPIISFTAEVVSDHYQKNKTCSIHLQSFASLADVWSYIASQENIPDIIDWYPYKAPIAQTLEGFRTLKNHILRLRAWEMIFAIRTAALKSLEEQRAVGAIKHSLQATVTMSFDFNEEQMALIKYMQQLLKNNGSSLDALLKELLIVSSCTITATTGNLEQSPELSGLWILTAPAVGVKCPRCWHWTESNHPLELCDRCAGILSIR